MSYLKKEILRFIIIYSIIFLGAYLVIDNSERIETHRISKRFKKSDTDNVLPFILNFPMNGKTPVIKMKANNKYLFFIVDTGATINELNSNGIAKMKNHIPIDSEYAVINNIRFFLDKENKYMINEDDSPIDGFLGTPFLNTFGTVTFDYVNQEIILCDSELENGSPFRVYKNHLYCDFEVYGKVFEGVIDTGAFCSAFNDQFFIENDYDDDVLKCMISGLSLSNQNYDDIEVYRTSNPALKVNEPARDFMVANNILGANLFLNHKLKIDFVNKLYEVL